MPIITPPFRTSLLTQNGIPFGTDTGDIQTTKDWWLYWQQLTDQGNSNSKLATEGTHADRPENMPDGALYYESDRGVLYAHADGHWQYAAGTMYGTLSPDQRPTDLGTHDAGFEFRGTDVARQFLWSQTAWVEVTAVQYGPHASRPNPATIVEGALYVESDRGGVIYQRETPAGTPLWQYLAGTMWGTLVPDQRPTDLGVHDAGFDFRSTDPPPREFIWDQTAWFETTPPQNSVQYAAATSTISATGTYQNLPGATLTLTRAGTYLVNAVFDFLIQNATTGLIALGQLTAGGVASSAVAIFQGVTTATGITVRATVGQQWTYVAASAGVVLQLQAALAGAPGTLTAGSPHTTISATWISA